MVAASLRDANERVADQHGYHRNPKDRIVPMTDRRRIQVWIGAAILLVGLVVVPFALIGGHKAAPKRQTQETEREDELAIVRDTLRRDVKLDSCKTAVAQLNVYLSRPNESKPSALAAGERDLLKSQVRLLSEEMKEIARDEFGTLDAHYLDEALLFHDGIASLKLNFADKSSSAALERARLAFVWAMRQTWHFEQANRPLPAGHALRAGVGNATERAGITMAVMQQLGLDSGLVGQKKDDRTMRPWAVGVRVENDVYLFDPRAGQPIMSADGKSIATLSQVRAAPELAKGPIGAAEQAPDVKAVVKESRVWLSPPLSALSPRMRWLQGVLVYSPPLVLGIDAAELRERFAKGGEKAEFWNPPADVASPTRRLAGLLPPSEGGFEPAGDRLLARYRFAAVPVDQVPRVLRSDLIRGEPYDNMFSLFSGRFISLYQEPGKARDLILRGQFDEASPQLIEALDRVTSMQRRIGNEEDLEKGAVEWAEKMRQAYAAWLRARDNPGAGEDPGAAKARVDALYKDSTKMALVIEQAVSEPYRAALAYQMALCKHELAERRLRDRSSPAEKRKAWRSAREWWDTNYLASFAHVSWVPRGQLDHAREMLAEVDRQLAALPK
jgi:hypothetical protein